MRGVGPGCRGDLRAGRAHPRLVERARHGGRRERPLLGRPRSARPPGAAPPSAAAGGAHRRHRVDLRRPGPPGGRPRAPRHGRRDPPHDRPRGHGRRPRLRRRPDRDRPARHRRPRRERSDPRRPVWVDSPMALAALDIYRDPAHAGRGAADALDGCAGSRARTAHSAEESIRLNTPGTPCIIVSASGMATGGRVMHHLRHLLPQARNTVLLTGYQAVGTRGRDLQEGARELKMAGHYVPGAGRGRHARRLLGARRRRRAARLARRDARAARDACTSCTGSPRRRRPWRTAYAGSSTVPSRCRATASGCCWTEDQWADSLCSRPEKWCP